MVHDKPKIQDGRHRGEPHTLCGQTAQVLCGLCYAYYRPTRVHRSEQLIRHHDAHCQLMRDRLNGVPVTCDFCGAIEPKHEWSKKAKTCEQDRHALTKGTLQIRCHSCKGKRYHQRVSKFQRNSTKTNREAPKTVKRTWEARK
ncbi:hypothetical protein BJY00DRAFT_278294 [Aspergillus carlsbadensis]|nr:hypothetical protein BJY00DRAFT_278294 [Aspergillus carlsbadensis]